MNCPNCGLPAHETDKFCIGCGAPLRKPQPEIIPEPAAPAVEPAPAVEQAVSEAVEAPKAAENELKEAVAEAEKVFTAPEIPAAPAVPVVPAAPVEPVKPVHSEPVRPNVVPAKPDPARSKLDKPLTTWGFIWRILLFAIPVLGIIPLFVMAFSKGVNKNSKHFASAVLILMLVCLLLCIAGAIYVFCTYDAATINDWITNFLNNFSVGGA